MIRDLLIVIPATLTMILVAAFALIAHLLAYSHLPAPF
jgi:hypothetical protein